MSTILQGRPGVPCERERGPMFLSDALTLDDDVTVFAEGRALHGVGRGGPGAGLEDGEERTMRKGARRARRRRGEQRRRTCSKLC